MAKSEEDYDYLFIQGRPYSFFIFRNIFFNSKNSIYNKIHNKNYLK